MTEPRPYDGARTLPVQLRSPGGADPAVTVWADLLDRMDEGLDSFPPVTVAELPADPGPIPAALAERAVRTFRRMAEAEAQLDGQRADIARELIGLAAARTAAATTTASTVPRFLDTRA